jgi:DNA polymerase-3 subunit alpha
VLPPDINNSAELFTIEKEGDSSAIRFGLGAIKNVGMAAIRPIIAVRERSGPFKSIDDFCHRAELQGVNKRALESLIKAGALDCLADRGALFGGIDRILLLAQRGRRLKEMGQATMFDLWGGGVAVTMPGLELPAIDIPVREKSVWERELLGVSFSERPFGLGLGKPPAEVDTFCGQIDEEMVGQAVVTAGQVMSVRQSFTKDGRPFVSAVLGDVDGSIEVTAWAEVYERTKELWLEGNSLVVRGKVKVRGERVQLVCQSVTPYPQESERQVEQPRPRALHIRLAQTDDAETDIARLRDVFDVLKGFPGEDSVHLAIIDSAGVTKLDVPKLTTGYCTKLHQQLVHLVGERGLTVKTEMD